MDKTQPKVSVIVPCYNVARYLDNFFAGVMEDTHTHVELIMVDDGSDDDTGDKILSYRKAIADRGGELKYIRQPNGGPSAAVSAGLKHFSGDYLIWPDADDRLINDSIAGRVAYMEGHRHVDMLWTNWVQVAECEPDKVVFNSSAMMAGLDPATLFDRIMDGKVHVGTSQCMARGSAVRERLPDLELPMCRHGQNYQMVLPLLYGKTPAILHDSPPYYKYYIRQGSLSHPVTPELAMIYSKILSLGDAVVRTVRRIPCMPPADREHYLNKARALPHRMVLWYAYLYADKQAFITHYREFCAFDKPDRNMRIKNIIMKHPALMRILGLGKAYAAWLHFAAKKYMQMDAVEIIKSKLRGKHGK